MALCYQPNIVAKDLQFAFDAANPKCYPGSGNLIYSLAGNGITGGLENGTSVSSNLACVGLGLLAPTCIIAF